MTADYIIFRFCAGEPNFDALPVMKVRHYPFEKADYKPFAQGQLCLDKQGDLIARLWAFEAKHEPDSTLTLALAGENGKSLCVSASVGGLYRAAIDGAPTDLPVSFRPIAGEDLQGEYWGIDITLDKNIVENLGINLPENSTYLWGNLYKSCEGEHPHFGSFMPVTEQDFTACPACLKIVDF